MQNWTGFIWLQTELTNLVGVPQEESG